MRTLGAVYSSSTFWEIKLSLLNRFHCPPIKTADCNAQNTNTEDDRGISVHHRQASLRNNLLPVRLRFKLKRIQRTRPYCDADKEKRQIFHRYNVYYDAAFGCLGKTIKLFNPRNNVLCNYFEMDDHPYPIQRVRFVLTLSATS